eukprot:403363484
MRNVTKKIVLSILGLIYISAQSLQYYSDEESFLAISKLAQNINGGTIPKGAANKIETVIEGLAYKLADIGLFAQNTKTDAEKQTLIENLAYFDHADDVMYGEADRTFAILFRGQGKYKCYNHLSIVIDQVYIGWQKWQGQYTGTVEEAAKEDTFEGFCNDEPNFSYYVDLLIDLLSGSSDCDALQTLYNGDPHFNIWAGWRDNIVDKAAYLLMYLSESITIYNACQVHYKQTQPNYDQNAFDQQSALYEESFQHAIYRVREYESLALTSIDQTIQDNLISLLQAHQGINIKLMAQNVNGYTLNMIYNEWDINMIAMKSDVPPEKYYIECSNCVIVTLGDYTVIVEGFADFTTPNQNLTLGLNSLESDNMNKTELADTLWSLLGNCTSGIAWIDKDVDFYVNNQQGEKFVSKQGETKNIFAWGTNEICSGRPINQNDDVDVDVNVIIEIEIELPSNNNEEQAAKTDQENTQEDSNIQNP